MVPCRATVSRKRPRDRLERSFCVRDVLRDARPIRVRDARPSSADRHPDRGPRPFPSTFARNTRFRISVYTLLERPPDCRQVTRPLRLPAIRRAIESCAFEVLPDDRRERTRCRTGWFHLKAQTRPPAFQNRPLRVKTGPYPLSNSNGWRTQRISGK